MSHTNNSVGGGEQEMPVKKGRARGFAAMDSEKQREIASRGGRARKGARRVD